jgi:hypothetical protein
MPLTLVLAVLPMGSVLHGGWGSLLGLLQLRIGRWILISLGWICSLRVAVWWCLAGRRTERLAVSTVQHRRLLTVPRCAVLACYRCTSVGAIDRGCGDKGSLGRNWMKQALLVEANTIVTSAVRRILVARAANLSVCQLWYCGVDESCAYLALTAVLASNGSTLTWGWSLRGRWLLVIRVISVRCIGRGKMVGIRLWLHWLRRLVHVLTRILIAAILGILSCQFVVLYWETREQGLLDSGVVVVAGLRSHHVEEEPTVLEGDIDQHFSNLVVGAEDIDQCSVSHVVEAQDTGPGANPQADQAMQDTGHCLLL